eukprot:5207451-Pyramimonas_sp.AAC.1
MSAVGHGGSLGGAGRSVCADREGPPVCGPRAHPGVKRALQSRVPWVPVSRTCVHAPVART